jgi:hypothetical protein
VAGAYRTAELVFGDRVAELAKQRLEFRAAAVDIADYVERRCRLC